MACSTGERGGENGSADSIKFAHGLHLDLTYDLQRYPTMSRENRILINGVQKSVSERARTPSRLDADRMLV